MVRRGLAVVLAISLATAPLTVIAGEAEDRATARQLATEGIEAANAGNCDTAIERLARAEKLFHAPIHLQYLARCYSKQGRLVEAAEAWRALTLETLPPNSPPVFKEAVAEAKVELPKIEPRLAKLTITAAATYPELTLTIDGKPLSDASIGVARVADPGKHVVHATATGYQGADFDVELPEGGAGAVMVTLQAAAPVADAGPAPDAGSPPVVDKSPFPWKTVGLVTASIGGALLVGGLFTGLSARSKYHTLQDNCPSKQCKPGYDLSGQQNSINSLTTTTNVLFVAGGILAVAGISAFFLAPEPKSGGGVALAFAPDWGGGHVGLTGSF